MRKITISQNTDAVDIDQKSLGLDARIYGQDKVYTNRGLHIQIRHNGDRDTFEQAVSVSRLLATAAEMAEALDDIQTLIKAPGNKANIARIERYCQELLKKAR